MPAGLPEGKIAAGFRQVMRAIAQGKAARIYVAQDAQESIRAIAAAEAAGVPVEQAESMAVLGRACRISVSCAAAAVLK